MGTLTLPASGSVYIDANTVIYRIEAVQPFLRATQPLWDALDVGTQLVIQYLRQLCSIEASVGRVNPPKARHLANDLLN